MNSKNRNGFWKLKFVSIIRYDDENFTLNIFYAFYSLNSEERHKNLQYIHDMKYKWTSLIFEKYDYSPFGMLKEFYFKKSK